MDIFTDFFLKLMAFCVDSFSVNKKQIVLFRTLCFASWKKKEIKVVIFATKPINWRFFSEITLEVVCGHVIAKRLEPQIR